MDQTADEVDGHLKTSDKMRFSVSTANLNQDLDLRCDKISYVVTNPEGEQKKVIDGLTMHSKRGELVAFMGPSGSGKTSALKASALRILTGRGQSLEGSITMNSEPVTVSQMRSLSGFIPQEDNILATMTVWEAVNFAAELRLGTRISKEERTSRANAMIVDLGLEKCRNTFVGTPDEVIRGVSGGERRRVSLAVELLSKPVVVFADEPTSGLDAYNALIVMQFLKDLCDQRGNIVLVSIHQPNSEIFAMFSKLLLLDRGRTMFFGDPVAEGFSTFEKCGAPVPPLTNPADHYIFSISGSEPETLKLKDRLHEEVQAKLAKQLQASKSNATLKDVLAELRQEAAPIQRQFQVLFVRALRNQVRNPFLTGARIALAVFMGGMMGGLFNEMTNNQAGLGDRRLLLSVCCFLPTLLAIAPVIQSFPAEKPTIIREYGSQMYSMYVYTISRGLVELPIMLAAPLIMSSLLFWIPGLNNTYDSNFVHFYLGMMLLLSVTQNYGYILGALAPNAQVAIACLPVVLTSEFSFSGGFSDVKNVPVFLRWLENFSSMRYAMAIFRKVEYEGLDFFCEEDEYIRIPLPDIFSDGLRENMTALGGMVSSVQSAWDTSNTIALSQVFQTDVTAIPQPVLQEMVKNITSQPAVIIEGMGEKLGEFLEQRHAQEVVDYIYTETQNLTQLENWPTTGDAAFCPVTDGAAILEQFTMPDLTVDQCLFVLIGFFVFWRFVFHMAILKVCNPHVRILPQLPARTKSKIASVPPVAVTQAGDAAESERPVLPISPSGDSTSIVVEAKGINYVVPGQKGFMEKGPVEDKMLVRNIDVTLKSGDMIAMMGTSGSGKTTCLRILADKRKAIKNSVLKGEVTVNGKPISQSDKTQSVFIPQNDALLATATVQEMMEFSAYLRLPAVMTQEEKLKKVNRLIDRLGLGNVRGTFVGSDDEIIRGLSGGERRRLSIGVELITDPKLIFADEPTSGLDAHSAITCLEIMRNLASEQNAMVCFSIHQPSTKMLNLFDKIMLMAETRCVYYGSLEDSIPFFAAQGFPLPDLVNPADHYMSVLSSGTLESRLALSEKIEAAFKKLPRTNDPGELPRGDFQKDAAKAPPGALGSMLPLMARLWKNQWRNPMLLMVRIIQSFVIGAVFSMMYGFSGIDGKERSQSGAFELESALFMAASMSYILSLMGTLQTFVPEKVAIVREVSSGFYSVGSYFMARTIVELPQNTIIPIVFAAVSKIVLGFNLPFVDWAIIQILMQNAGQSVGFLLAGPFQTVEEAANAEGPFTMIQFLFGGFFINLNTLPSALQFMQYASLLRYCMGAAYWKEFADTTFFCTDEEIEALQMGDPNRVVECPITDGMQLIEGRSYENLDHGTCILGMLMVVIVFRCLAILVVWLSIRKQSA